MLQLVLRTRKTNSNNIGRTGGRNIFGAVSHLPNHLASLIMDYHVAAAQTDQQNYQLQYLVSCWKHIPAKEFLQYTHCLQASLHSLYVKIM